MRKTWPVALFVTGVATAVAVGVVWFSHTPTEVWTRETPLASPVGVTSIANGELVLNDGRHLRPAGVRKKDSVTQEDFERALRVITAQGVEVLRDLGDGRAFLIAEPRFYNWSDRVEVGIRWKRWAGSFIPCPLSELLIQAGYAEFESDQQGIKPRELWRLAGAAHWFGTPVDDSPTQIFDSLNALRYDGSTSYFKDYDLFIEGTWKPPPQE